VSITVNLLATSRQNIIELIRSQQVDNKDIIQENLKSLQKLTADCKLCMPMLPGSIYNAKTYSNHKVYNCLIPLYFNVKLPVVTEFDYNCEVTSHYLSICHGNNERRINFATQTHTVKMARSVGRHYGLKNLRCDSASSQISHSGYGTVGLS